MEHLEQPQAKKAKVEKLVPLGNIATSCSDKALAWLIDPVTVADFTSTYWDSRPLLISRHKPEYFEGLVVTEKAIKLLTDDQSAEDFELSAAEKKMSWLHALVERLENFTGTLWSSSYHYCQHAPTTQDFFSCDTKEANTILIQLTGTCHWRAADDSDSTLFQIDSLLYPGDTLYLPQTAAASSLVTSGPCSYVILRTVAESWGDFLLQALPEVIPRLLASDPDFQRSLPLNWTSSVGLCVKENDLKLKPTLEALLAKIATSMDFVDLADQQAMDITIARTPPAPRKGAASTFGPDPRLHACTVRLRNPAWVRVAAAEGEDGEHVTLIVTSVGNDIKKHGEAGDEPQIIELSGNDKVPALRELFQSWPEFAGAGSLGLELTTALWEGGILETRV